MPNTSLETLALDPNTVLTTAADDDLILIGDVSEAIEARETKVIEVANLINKTYAIEFPIGDGVNAITTTPAVRGRIVVPVASTITGWTLGANASGSIVLDVWKDTYANYPPTNADTIAGIEKPTLSAAIKNQDLSLSTWTVTCAAGDWLFVEVESATTVKQVTLCLHMVKA